MCLSPYQREKKKKIAIGSTTLKTPRKEKWKVEACAKRVAGKGKKKKIAVPRNLGWDGLHDRSGTGK